MTGFLAASVEIASSSQASVAAGVLEALTSSRKLWQRKRTHMHCELDADPPSLPPAVHRPCIGYASGMHRVCIHRRCASAVHLP